MEKIKITLVSGQEVMPKRHPAECEPYAIVHFCAQKYVSTSKKGFNPTWNEAFVFDFIGCNYALRVDLKNKDWIKIPNALDLGHDEIDIGNLLTQLPARVNLKMKFGTVQILIEDPSNAQHFGGTLTRPMAATLLDKITPVDLPAAQQQKPKLNRGWKREEREAVFRQPIQVFKGPTVYDRAIGNDDQVPPTQLPGQFVQNDSEVIEQKKRWQQFALTLSQSHDYSSKYKKQLQELDGMGCINLGRIKREQIPPLEINYCAALFFNPYENLPHTLDLGPVNDGLAMARVFTKRGYRVFYFCDATPLDYWRWLDWLLEHVELELVVYFSGHGTQIPDRITGEKDTLSELYVFYNQDTKTKVPAIGGMPPRIQPVDGIADETVSDTAVHNLIKSKEYPQTRVVLINDYCRTASLFNISEPVMGRHRRRPPPSVVSIGAYQDTRQSKQLGLGGLQMGIFSGYFAQLIDENPRANFMELQQFMAKRLEHFQSVEVTGSDAALYQKPVVIDVEGGDRELQLQDIDTTGVEIQKTLTTSDNLSRIEEDEALQRWWQFQAELRKPVEYNSLFKDELKKLDSLGCINLERIKREQIPPNGQFDHVAALFFCPYENLPYTLDVGPVNDALLMAELFVGRRYTVFYLCDPTPHEYYKWMDWIIEHVETKFVSFFSGHGAEIKKQEQRQSTFGSRVASNESGPEVLLFYNAKNKQGGATGAVGSGTKPQIPTIKGITDETIDETVIHDLIIRKAYNQTRFVLLTDCCHSDGKKGEFGKKKKVKQAPFSNNMSIVLVGSQVDLQAAREAAQGSVEAGVFAYNFCSLLKQAQHANFLDLEAHLAHNVQKNQDITIASTQQNAGLTKAIIVDAKL